MASCDGPLPAGAVQAPVWHLSAPLLSDASAWHRSRASARPRLVRLAAPSGGRGTRTRWKRPVQVRQQQGAARIGDGKAARGEVGHARGLWVLHVCACMYAPPLWAGGSAGIKTRMQPYCPLRALGLVEATHNGVPRRSGQAMCHHRRCAPMRLRQKIGCRHA